MSSPVPDQRVAASASRTPAEARRTEVYRLLAQGLDVKVLMGGGDHAARWLEEAYKLARKPHPLHWPYPQITAYRLAYILMRSARSPKDLRQIDNLLNEAAAGETIDPLQHALHIVVVERLRELSAKPGERDVLRQRAGKLFSILAETSRKADRTPAGRPVQNDLFNLVELCGFLVGGEFSQIEGRAHISDPLMPVGDEGVALVGTGDVDHGVRWTASLARGEFDARLREGSVDVAFEWIDAPILVYPQRQHISLAVGEHLPEFCLSQSLRLDTVESNRFDVSLLKARQTIAKILAANSGRRLKHTEVIASMGNRRYAFHPDLRVLGLVSSRHLTALSRI